VKRIAALLEVEIAVQEGDLAQGRASLSAVTAPVGGAEPPAVPAAVRVADGRLHLAEGDPTAALEKVTPCLSGPGDGCRLVDAVAALLVAATAQRRLGTQASATGYLEQALALARDDGLVRVFLDAGRGVRALLTVVIPPEGPHASFRSALLHRFDVQPTASWKSPEQTVRLTASERAVLHYLPSHLTNEEIAQDLCLSVNTVKSHLRTLYRKLGVGCRREAIARALQLELLR
jgi:LuxR family maltose regulon positive regulatory protein